MNLREEILQEHSKEQTLRLAAYIGNDPDRVAQMMEVFLRGDYRESQRMAWVVNFVSEKFPEAIIPYLPIMIKNLENPVHDAVIRNTVRFLQDIDIPEDLMGEVADKCFEYLQSPLIPAAIRVFAMTVLYNISNTWPELKRELSLVIEEHLEFSSAAFKSRGKKILNKLKKEIKE